MYRVSIVWRSIEGENAPFFFIDAAHIDFALIEKLEEVMHALADLHPNIWNGVAVSEVVSTEPRTLKYQRGAQSKTSSKIQTNFSVNEPLYNFRLSAFYAVNYWIEAQELFPAILFSHPGS